MHYRFGPNCSDSLFPRCRVTIGGEHLAQVVFENPFTHLRALHSIFSLSRSQLVLPPPHHSPRPSPPPPSPGDRLRLHILSRYCKTSDIVRKKDLCKLVLHAGYRQDQAYFKDMADLGILEHGISQRSPRQQRPMTLVMQQSPTVVLPTVVDPTFSPSVDLDLGSERGFQDVSDGLDDDGGFTSEEEQSSQGAAERATPGLCAKMVSKEVLPELQRLLDMRSW